MKNKLIIVEGLPCSGKSTAAAHIAETLKKSGYNAVFTDEGTGNHPADYEFQSYISDENMKNFSAEEQPLLKNSSARKNGGYITELSKLEGELFNKALQYKIYDFLPWETEKTLILDKWQDFVKNVPNDTINVFNCCFLQNPMCETMMRFNFDEKTSKEFITEIAEIIKPLDPLCIYIRQKDFAEKILKTAKEREGWLDAVIDYHINGAYGKSCGLKGFDGYIKCLEERQRREVAILESLDINKLVLDLTSYDKLYEQINNAIL